MKNEYEVRGDVKSTIMINQANKHIGYFRSIEEAEQAVIEARMNHMPYSLEASL